MAKTIIGIDIGHNQLKIAQVKDKKVKRSAIVKMPENVIEEGHITAPEEFGRYIRKAMRAHRIHGKRAAVIISNESVYVRDIMMPIMTEDQLKTNLPFEFHDYIMDDYRNYVYDYSMVSTPDEMMKMLEAENEEGESEKPDDKDEGPQMLLMGAAIRREYLNSMREMLRKAGLKMVKVSPVIFSYQALIRNYMKENKVEEIPFCIVDLGYERVRMYIFNGEIYSATREMDRGLYLVENAIAEAYKVDKEKAREYLETNYDHCQEKEVCTNLWNTISVDLMRSLNFYQFSNPKVTLEQVWLCGGGTAIPALCEEIKQMIRMDIHYGDELLPASKKEVKDGRAILQAVGITQEIKG